MWSSLVLLFLAGSLITAAIPLDNFRVGALPNPKYTPGKLCTPQDIYFEGFRYPCEIAYCTRHVTVTLKRTVAAYYGVPEEDWSLYEFDHWYPLSIGGCNDETNLWPQVAKLSFAELLRSNHAPQPIDEAHEKDSLESQLYHALSNGTMDQAEAVAKIKAWRPLMALIESKNLTSGDSLSQR